MKRIIFLDFDGVISNDLAKENLRKGIGPFHFREICKGCTSDPAIIERLRKVVEDLDLEIVVTSTWRHLPEACWKALRWTGWSRPPIIDFTEVNGKTRGEQIADWLAARQKYEDIDAFVVIDDDLVPEFKDRQVFPDTHIGLTDDDIDRIRVLFS